MKILLVNDNYSHIGGAETYFFNLYKLLKENNNEVSIFSTGAQEIRSNDTLVAQEMRRRKRLFESESFKDIKTWILRKFIANIDDSEFLKNKIPLKFQKNIMRYQYIQLFGNYYIDTSIEKKLRYWVDEISPSVIHIHNNYKYPTSIYSELKGMNIPLIKTVHDFGMVCPTSWCIKPDGKICKGGLSKNCVEAGCITNKYYKLMEAINKIVNDLEKNSVILFIAPSKSLKQKMEEHGFNNIVHVPNFINVNDYKVDISKMEIGNILYVGGLTKHKGVHYLIEAFPRILEEFPDASLNIIGSGPLRSCLDNRVRQLGVENCVVFHGKVSDDVVKELYQKANVVVIPSIWMENSPMVIYEAMASGRPVVGSNIGGIPELIRDGENGFLTEPRNPEDIAEKVIKILSDINLAEKFGTAAKKIAVSEYSSEKHYENLIKVYKSLIC